MKSKQQCIMTQVIILVQQVGTWMILIDENDYHKHFINLFSNQKTRLTEIIHRFLIHEQDMQDWHRYSTDFKFMNKIGIHFSLILNLWTKLMHNFYQPSKNESKNCLHETFLLDNITCKKLLDRYMIKDFFYTLILLFRQFSTCSCC